jgi:hypothetical protein
MKIHYDLALAYWIELLSPTKRLHSSFEPAQIGSYSTCEKGGRKIEGRKLTTFHALLLPSSTDDQNAADSLLRWSELFVASMALILAASMGWSSLPFGFHARQEELHPPLVWIPDASGKS